MVAEKTFHVYRAESGSWAVKKAGAKSTVFRSQYEALKAARSDARNQTESQVVVHRQDGQFVIKEVHGLPVVQKPPRKSSLGTASISRAISDSVRKRLETV
jgi:hypothetical protein